MAVCNVKYRRENAKQGEVRDRDTDRHSVVAGQEEAVQMSGWARVRRRWQATGADRLGGESKAGAGAHVRTS